MHEERPVINAFAPLTGHLIPFRVFCPTLATVCLSRSRTTPITLHSLIPLISIVSLFSL